MKTLLSAASFVAVLATAAGAAGNGPMSGFVEEWDMDANGVVTVEDFQSRRAEQFAMFDLDGSGAIDGEEQANMANTIAIATENHGEGHGEGHGAGGPGAKIHGSMTADYADTDKDGAISADEWADAGARLFTDLDKTADGELSPADFGH